VNVLGIPGWTWESEERCRGILGIQVKSHLPPAEQSDPLSLRLASEGTKTPM
jgi:hypothetical protein